jgi:glycosyltransferase involved in cell wall biosynthesis
MIQHDTFLSICIPAYNRPVWFERALRSIVSDLSVSKQSIEIIISDDSTSEECLAITEKVVKPLGITYKYVHNKIRLGMAANWNNSLKLASGKYVLILHDDDFLLAGAVNRIIRAIEMDREQYPIMLFGVHVVNEQEKVIKKQLFRRRVYWQPKKALLKVLSNSSFVRFPGIVVRRDIFEQVGYFDTAIGSIADLDMWIRLFSSYGVLCCPFITCAYTVHTAALTTEMFNTRVIKQLAALFSQIAENKFLPLQLIEKCKSDFFHQFILAGTYRKLKQRKFFEARKLMKLFNINEVNHLHFSSKWFCLRFLFRIILLV